MKNKKHFRVFLISTLVIIFSIFSLVLLRSGYATLDVNNQHTIWPAYIYPDIHNPSNAWKIMCDSMNTNSQGSIVIMNPATIGPGETQIQDYVDAVDYCRNQGHDVIGYVSTQGNKIPFNPRNIQTVKEFIKRYYDWYDVDGIFIDEMANVKTTATVAYYSSLYKYIHSLGGSSQDYVIGNPGAAASTPWQLNTPVADTIVIKEDTGDNYLSWIAPAWVATKTADEIATIIHSTSASAMQNVCQHSKGQNSGFVYITDDLMPNPYNELPSYLTSEFNCMW